MLRGNASGVNGHGGNGNRENGNGGDRDNGFKRRRRVTETRREDTFDGRREATRTDTSDRVNERLESHYRSCTRSDASVLIGPPGGPAVERDLCPSLLLC